MTTNLDRSLDEILSSNRKNKRTSTKAGPTGGVKKRSSARVQQQQARAATTTTGTKDKKASPKGNDTKIVVSNLPIDVKEADIKEYFGLTVGAVKRVALSYGPNGVSRGIATVEFVNPGHANTAYTQENGKTIDKKKTMKIEIIVDPTKPLTLADRIGGGQQKNAPKAVSAASKPKPATNNGNANNGANKRGGTIKRGRGGRRGGAGGPGAAKKTPKTAEELDAEMADYFTAPSSGGDNTAQNGAQAAKADEDEAMV